MNIFKRLSDFFNNFFKKSIPVRLAEAIEEVYGVDDQKTRLLRVNNIYIYKKKISFAFVRQRKFTLNKQDLVLKLSKKLLFPKKYIFLKEFKNGTYMLSFDNKIRQILANQN